MATGIPDFSYPFSGLSVGIGNVSASGFIGALTSEKIDASGGAITRTLPLSAGTRGSRFKVQKVDASANAVSLITQGSDVIRCSRGTVTQVDFYSQFEYIWVESDGDGHWDEG